MKSDGSYRALLIIWISENLTNDAEAVLEARLLKCKRPADDSSDGRQRQQREADDRWNGADGHVRSAVIHHHIRVEIITGKIHRHRWVSHNHPATHFTVHPLRNTCVRSSHIIMTVAFLRIQILHWTQHSTKAVYCIYQISNMKSINITINGLD